MSLANTLQLYSLAVPTEKAPPATTTKIVLTVPAGFSIDSFVPSPGWHRVLQQTGSGDSAVIQKVTWTGGKIPSGEDSLFQFLGQPAKPGTYTFQVEQTYSDSSIVDWSGSESSAAPAPTIEARARSGAAARSLLAIVALVVAAVAHPDRRGRGRSAAAAARGSSREPPGAGRPAGGRDAGRARGARSRRPRTPT